MKANLIFSKKNNHLLSINIEKPPSVALHCILTKIINKL